MFRKFSIGLMSVSFMFVIIFAALIIQEKNRFEKHHEELVKRQQIGGELDEESLVALTKTSDGNGLTDNPLFVGAGASLLGVFIGGMGVLLSAKSRERA